MADISMTDRCDCGATAGPLGMCVDYYHGILAEEQSDPQMFRWHACVVVTYLLQHPSRAHEKYLDDQYRQLQLYVDQGLDALLRLAAHRVARNNHRARRSHDTAPLTAYAPLPKGEPPGFSASFSGLPVKDGSFVFDGHSAYGDRIKAIAEATVESWKSVQS
ncbi:DUF5946 family protein [Nonomuraea sp. NPDC049419]|uniref:DUF5946 family protein n=1 Tax=Nonomuraea sp. NPDC049419 TaxID=3155772 RepID=UPI003449006D